MCMHGCFGGVCFWFGESLWNGLLNAGEPWIRVIGNRYLLLVDWVKSRCMCEDCVSVFGREREVCAGNYFLVPERKISLHGKAGVDELCAKAYGCCGKGC